MSRSLSLNSVDLSYSQPIPHPNSIPSGSGATSSTSPTAPFHSDFALTPASSSFPMDPDMSARFASYDLADASTASSSGSSSSSNGCSGAVPNIDQLLAISKAQADIAGDANLFACPHCDKRYTGKHARSIWRRHLQDKHNIPLSIQPRRTRWDGDANRPKNAEERRARMLESKRRWARKKRLQEKLGSAAAAAAAMRESEERADDADISSMSFDDSFASVGDSSARPVLQPVAVAANGQQQSSVPSGSGSWISPARRAPSVGESSLFSSQERSKRPAPSAGGTDGADATPLTAFSSLYPTPPSATSAGAGAVAGLSLYSSPIRKAAAATGGVRMLSPSPTAAQRSAGNESFASSSASVSDYSLVDSHSGNTTADTSVSVSVCKKLPPPVGMPRKYDQKEAAIQLLALRSNSNSPTEAERRPAPASQAWDTPSKRHASPRRRSDPDPSTLMTPNPFSLDKHKISPFEGKRKLSFSHESPRPRLPPLASTPFELRSATKRPTAGAGAGAGTGVGVGATPLAGQFSSPQHLNLTESLGLAPHSVTRTLGLTPSIAGLAWPESVKRPFPFEMDDDDRALDLELDTPSKPRRRPRPLGLSLKANVSNLD